MNNEDSKAKLPRPRPNGSKVNALHSKIVKCNVKKNFVLEITQTGKLVRKKSFYFMAVVFVPAEFIQRFVAL